MTEYQNLFKSFFMGGFECATHRRRDNNRIDVIAKTAHDALSTIDYQLLASAGILTIRDGLRWHLIERTPGTYDWASLFDMLHAAHATGIQVIWDICHWGVPDDIDIFSAAFPLRFAAFAAAAATLIRDENLRASVTQCQVYCPINEISFWAWVGAEGQHFHPFARERGPELKRRLVVASLAAISAVRAVDPSARFLQAEPIIHISAGKDKPEDGPGAARHTESQFEAWDMIAGLRDRELGGSASSLDVIGVNHYWNNQWIHEGDRTPLGHELHRPLHDHLFGLWQRYGRPVLIAETGAEGSAAVGWLGYIAAEVRQAIRLGVPVLGICLYPVMDYPGWDDDRHCRVGLLQSAPDWKSRSLRDDLASEIKLQSSLFATHDPIPPGRAENL